MKCRMDIAETMSSEAVLICRMEGWAQNWEASFLQLCAFLRLYARLFSGFRVVGFI